MDAVVKVLQYVYPPCGKSGVTSLPDIGINSGCTTDVGGVSASIHYECFDRNGDPV